jgi:hypothetical protein
MFAIIMDIIGAYKKGLKLYQGLNSDDGTDTLEAMEQAIEMAVDTMMGEAANEGQATIIDKYAEAFHESIMHKEDFEKKVDTEEFAATGEIWQIGIDTYNEAYAELLGIPNEED